MISELPEEDWIRTKVEAETVDGDSGKENAVVIDFEDDPDGGSEWEAVAHPFLPLADRSWKLIATRTARSGTTSFDPRSPSVDEPRRLFCPVRSADRRDAGGRLRRRLPHAAHGGGADRDQCLRLARPARAVVSLGHDGQGAGPRSRSRGVGAGLETDGDSNGNGVDDGLETYQRVWLEKDQWAYPLQMLQKDADFEQVGELANTFLWGHALRHRRGITTPDLLGSTPLLPTVYTFGEIMNSKRRTIRSPVLRSDLVDSGCRTPRASARIDSSRIRATSAFQPGSAVESFRPFTQVVEVATIDEPWTPRRRIYLSLFDAVVCDGPGCNAASSGTVSRASNAWNGSRSRTEGFNNAAGFSGRGPEA